MLTGALVCPHPPLLLPGVTGRAGEVDPELSQACRDGVRELLTPQPGLVVLVGGASATRTWDAAAPRGADWFSAGRVAEREAGPGAAVLPLSLAVGQELLDAAGWAGPRELRSVAADAFPADCLALGAELAALPGRAALLVLGDGSARRSLKAPGYLDERAAAYDDQARRGLAGDLAALRSLDPNLGRDLLVAGRAAWQVLAGAAATAPQTTAEIRYADDPFGVYYLVATWRVPHPRSP